MRTGRFLVLFGAFPHGLPDKVSQHSKQVRRGDLLDGGRTETQLLARHRGRAHKLAVRCPRGWKAAGAMFLLFLALGSEMRMPAVTRRLLRPG
jgi:hypothetical protein